ncbi:MAG: SDR family oxidoreductase [Oscillospiraceae bacterium]|jgi:NAD(P)-dependent dehydrogenase (short-subunit alcohol dehydrogenase family)|nr:SDR family oxidoreductase [Oscillospiraceae bacterium]
MAQPRQAQSIRELRGVYDMLSLKGKAAVVTGAAGGIGRSTAAAMAELGARVALMDIPKQEDRLRQNVADIKERYGAEAMYVLGDVSVPESVQSFVNEVVKNFGTIDILHNNAGIGIKPDNAEISFEQWNKIVSVNLHGAMLTAQAVMRVMKEHKHGGSIVTTSSMSGLIVNTGIGYASTKAAVRHMTNAMAMELAPFGIRCNTVCYGFILSGMHENMNQDSSKLNDLYDMFGERTPLGFMGELSDAVGCVVFLASDLSRFATGSTIVIDGGFTTK